MIKSKDFIAKCYWLVNDVPNYYYSGSDWLRYDKNQNKFKMDCVLSVKGLFWGFSADKNKDRGGAKYKSNGVPDFTCNGALDYCTNVGTDFSNLKPCTYLCMKNTKYNHTGIYLGEGKVFECTTGGNTKKCIISTIDNKGNRFINGKQCLKWTYKGEMTKWIDYEDQKPKIEEIEEQLKVVNKKYIDKWNLNFSKWNEVEAVEVLEQNQVVIIKGIYKHSLGGKYYITKDDFINNNFYGINSVDLDDYIEPKEDIPTYYEKQESNNSLLHLIEQIVNIIKKLKEIFK